MKTNTVWLLKQYLTLAFMLQQLQQLTELMLSQLLEHKPFVGQIRAA